MSDFVPVRLEKTGDSRLEIEWDDGAVHRIRFFHLRKACPCATCLEKAMAKPNQPMGMLPILTQAQAQPLDITSMRPAGNYAYHIQFSDGHSSGIFTLDMLRLIGEESLRHEAT